VEVTGPIIDTIIIEELKPIPVQKFDWHDSWVSVSGVIKEEQVSCHIQSVDTLVQVVHRVPKSFWFIKWGTKAIRQEIMSKNPHSQTVYTEYIELKK
jgi:ASC-1-like (ASCH) protein